MPEAGEALGDGPGGVPHRRDWAAAAEAARRPACNF